MYEEMLQDKITAEQPITSKSQECETHIKPKDAQIEQLNNGEILGQLSVRELCNLNAIELGWKSALESCIVTVLEECPEKSAEECHEFGNNLYEFMVDNHIMNVEAAWILFNKN